MAKKYSFNGTIYENITDIPGTVTEIRVNDVFYPVQVMEMKTVFRCDFNGEVVKFRKDNAAPRKGSFWFYSDCSSIDSTLRIKLPN